MSRYRRGGAIARTAPRAQEKRRGNRVFYIVAEGEGTEYDYLGYLHQRYGPDLGFLLRFPSQRNGLSPAQAIEVAGRGTQEPGVRTWALFDHDRRADIDQVCARASRDGISVALSHPAFELWLLLHFQDFAPATQSGRNHVILERLRAAHPAFTGYREGSKRIGPQRFAALSDGDNLRQAVARARRLSRAFSYQTPANRDPSTDVYRLVEELGIVSPPPEP